MFSNKFNTAKCETASRLCVGRIKLIRNKKTVQLKQSQKDIAELLRSGKQEYARIRVEGVIREKLMLQAFEILELYLELLTVRTQLVAKTQELPRDMMEAVSSIIYAAQRISDLPELSTLRALFASKYGKEYATEAAADATTAKWQVNSNLIRCLLVEAPQPEEKLAQLSEIAQAYGVEWDLATAAREMGMGLGGPPPPACAPTAPTTGWAPPAAICTGPTGPPSAASYGSHVSTPTAAAAAAPGMPGAMLPGSAGSQYGAVQQAAQAAARAAAQAAAAAEYAAQVAAGGGGAHQLPPAQGWLAQQQPPPPAGPAPGPGAPQQLPPANGGPAWAAPPPLPDGYEAGLLRPSPSPSPPPPPHGDGGNGGGGGGGVTAGGYQVKSNEEIQRAYDAALGPPSKGATAAAPPPPQQPPPPPPPPQDTSYKSAPSAPPPPPQVEDEYEELTRRLEALKKS